MEFWIFLQIAIDIILLFIIYFYLIRDRNRLGGEPSGEMNEEKLEALSDSLGQMISESKRVLGEMFEKLESKEGQIDRLIEEGDELVSKLQKTISETLPKSEESHDKYQQALKLANDGLSADEISERVKLSKGEVGLILDLRKE